MIAQPIAPPPNATPGQVRRFLKEYFLSNRVELNENEAEEEATKLSIKLRVTGDGLYSLSKDTLIGTFGAEGELIYNILQSAKSGYFRKAAHGLCSKLFQRSFSLWPDAVRPFGTAKTRKTETWWSQGYSGALTRSYSPSTDSALPIESSHQNSGQNVSKFEAKVLQQSCHSFHGEEDHGDEDTSKRRNNVRLRRHFHLDTD